jgi:hypothetical protein
VVHGNDELKTIIRESTPPKLAIEPPSTNMCKINIVDISTTKECYRHHGERVTSLSKANGYRLRNILLTCFSYHWNGRKRSQKMGPMCMLTTTKDY